jgi:hypothetical protein
MTVNPKVFFSALLIVGLIGAGIYIACLPSPPQNPLEGVPEEYILGQNDQFFINSTGDDTPPWQNQTEELSQSEVAETPGETPSWIPEETNSDWSEDSNAEVLSTDYQIACSFSQYQKSENIDPIAVFPRQLGFMYAEDFVVVSQTATSLVIEMVVNIPLVIDLIYSKEPTLNDFRPVTYFQSSTSILDVSQSIFSLYGSMTCYYRWYSTVSVSSPGGTYKESSSSGRSITVQGFETYVVYDYDTKTGYLDYAITLRVTVPLTLN